MIQLLPLRKIAAPARRQRGYSKFEFALAAALFAVLTGIGADRLHAYQEDAETVAAKQLITSLQAALTLKTAHLAATQQRAGLAAPDDDNPIGWLYEKPKNYLGEYYSPDNQSLPPGNWYFDRGDKTLVYLPNGRKSFMARPSILLRFKVKSFRVSTVPGATPVSAAVEHLTLVQVFDDPGVSVK